MIIDDLDGMGDWTTNNVVNHFIGRQIVYMKCFGMPVSVALSVFIWRRIGIWAIELLFRA